MKEVIRELELEQIEMNALQLVVVRRKRKSNK